MNRPIARLLPLLAALLTTACGSSQPDSTTTRSPTATPTGLAALLPGTTSTSTSSTGATPKATSTDALLGLGCGWVLASDANTVNILFPDQAARYWVASIPMTPGIRLRIDGRYPLARYFSFNSYDLALSPTGAIHDAGISPVAGGHNPYTEQGALAGDSYTAYMAYGAIPTQPVANTFYSGTIPVGSANIPNLGVIPLIYRTYVGTGKLMDGGVGLPVLTLETTDGTALGTLPTCSEPLAPNLGGVLPNLGLNDLINSIDYPDNLLPLPFPTATYPAKTHAFHGLPDTLLNIVRDHLPAGTDASTLPGLPDTGGGGFLSNADNSYTSTSLSRQYGNLFVVRGKAPSFRTQSGIPFATEQVRYWSLCENEFLTERFTGCIYDSETPLDAQGYFTVAISDTADRPTTATAQYNIAWLPWGVYPDGVLLYRQLLANPGFAQAIANVPKDVDPSTVMGAYSTQSTYCRRAVFEQAANTAADRFAACVADQKSNPPTLGK